MFPSIACPAALTADQMREVDRLMIDDLGIDLARMMENAGRSLAELVIGLFHPASVSVLAGSGGNGGGAMVAARHLANRGVDVVVTTSRAHSELDGVTREQALILEKMGVEMTQEPSEAPIVVDGLIGYSLSGSPRGRARELIEWCATRRVVSLDVPSGLNATTGETPGVCVGAEATMTLALPKAGLIGSSVTGRLFLADISVPARVYRAFGLTIETPFERSPIVELTG